MVMQDLAGLFSLSKDKPLLSMACTKQGARLVEDYMSAQNFVKMAEWLPVSNKKPNLDIQAMPYYIFRNYDYPEHYDDKESREALLQDRTDKKSGSRCLYKTASKQKVRS